MLSLALSLSILGVVSPGLGDSASVPEKYTKQTQRVLAGGPVLPTETYTKTHLPSCQVVIQGPYHQVISVYATVPNTRPTERFVFVIVDGDFRGTQPVNKQDWPCDD